MIKSAFKVNTLKGEELVDGVYWDRNNITYVAVKDGQISTCWNVRRFTEIYTSDRLPIFEGDTVIKKFTAVDEEGNFKGVVKFLEGCFYIDNGESAEELFSESDELYII